MRQFSQDIGQNFFVMFPLVRPSKRPADRMIDEDGARGRDFAHDVEDGAGDQRGNLAALDDVGDETDGLVTEGSVRNEQRQVHSGRLQLPRYRRRDRRPPMKETWNGARLPTTPRLASSANAVRGKTISGSWRGTLPMPEW